uniref:Hemagglutinin 2 n=1 Tax=Eikenella corrodens TaxID=539 RepID=HAG2_EIKCO|nr:RecName: Full=Hemagglutinin 2 [Eikenella corrodens]CAA78254.1 Hemagglutinin protein [Eikenella corrodens]
MHFTQFMGQASVEQDTFGSSGFTRINVGRNTDITVQINRGFTSHFNRLSKLEAEVREGFVGFSHAVYFFTFFHGAATAFCGINQLIGQAQIHGFFATLAGCIAHPAHCQGQTAGRTNLNRNLVVSTTNTAAFHFHDGFGIVDGFVKHFDCLFALYFLGSLLQSTIHDALVNRFFTVNHQGIHKLGQFNAAELRIRQYVALRDFSTSWHFNFL